MNQHDHVALIQHSHKRLELRRTEINVVHAGVQRNAVQPQAVQGIGGLLRRPLRVELREHRERAEADRVIAHDSRRELVHLAAQRSGNPLPGIPHREDARLDAESVHKTHRTLHGPAAARPRCTDA